MEKLKMEKKKMGKLKMDFWSTFTFSKQKQIYSTKRDFFVLLKEKLITQIHIAFHLQTGTGSFFHFIWHTHTHTWLGTLHTPHTHCNGYKSSVLKERVRGPCVNALKWLEIMPERESFIPVQILR